MTAYLQTIVQLHVCSYGGDNGPRCQTGVAPPQKSEAIAVNFATDFVQWPLELHTEWSRHHNYVYLNDLRYM